MADTPSRPRGFGALDIERRREIARMGGKAAHAQGRAHEFTSEEARRAGYKGGKAVAVDRSHMAAIGREGGLARAARGTKPKPKTGAIQRAAPDAIEKPEPEEDEDE